MTVPILFLHSTHTHWVKPGEILYNPLKWSNGPKYPQVEFGLVFTNMSTRGVNLKTWVGVEWWKRSFEPHSNLKKWFFKLILIEIHFLTHCHFIAIGFST